MNVMYWELVFICFGCLYYALVQSGCVTPPLECPNENVTFWLYTRSNKDEPHQVIANNSESITSAPWVADAPIKILIHGYTGYKDFSPNTEIRPAYMECCNYNIISVDYNPIAREPCYIEAAKNTELVGMCTAQLIDELVYHHKFRLDQFHVIGFSLGGQTAGFVGDYLNCGKLERISGLDPAMPLFVTHDKNKKLDKGDAKYVDVVHTNSLMKGKLEACGHVDFYPNGGMEQPGCKSTKEQTRSGCDHARAPAYYAESINTDVGFYATKCYSWITYMIGWCELFNSSEDILFGEYVPYNKTVQKLSDTTQNRKLLSCASIPPVKKNSLLNVSGYYFFSTNKESPYAKGENKRN